ncbi:MAG: universal stress protein [Bacteroidota bacterium]
MFNVHQILLPHDLSEASDAALPYARALAERTDATVHLLHADLLHATTPATEAHMHARLAALQDRLDTDQVVVASVRGVSAGPVLLEYEASHDIDLIVMGTHGRRGMRRHLLGSVAREVVQCAQAPVLTVRPPAWDAHLSPSGGIRHVLVPVDFSEQASAAVGQAKAIAAAFEAKLSLLHVVEETLHPTFYSAGAFTIYDLQPDIEQRVGRFLRALYDRVPGPDVPYHTYVRPGRADQVITEFARKRSCDLILMPTHGLRGIEHMVMGSVAERVVRTAPCPVLTFKGHSKHLVSTRSLAQSEASAQQHPV